jgi:5-methylcytosine-specific restriction enzyme A
LGYKPDTIRFRFGVSASIRKADAALSPNFKQTAAFWWPLSFLEAMTKRTRGRKAVELRKRRLAAQPLCEHCLRTGRITAAVTPDHIIRLVDDGPDTDDNVQSLCRECHNIKSALEAGKRPRQLIDLDGYPVAGD